MAAAFVVGIDLGTTHTVVASAPLGAGGERGGEAGAITLFGIDQWVAPGELGRPALLPSVRYHPAPGELPLSAAILAVADTYDAIISDRPYRAGLSKERAREILREVSGSQLDSKVVQAFLAIEPRLCPEEADKLLLYTI